MKDFDLIVIGYGNGGRLLASTFAGEGKRVALIEKSERMYGGTCPNVGCIPTKLLVDRGEKVLIKEFHSFDSKARYYSQIIDEKEKVRGTILGMMKSSAEKNPNITLYTGTGSFISSHEVLIKGKDFTETVSAEKIVIDTGSSPRIPDIDGIRESRYVYTNEEMLECKKLPRKLVVIGGGNIGLEFACAYADFGSEVTVLQDLPALYPDEDPDVVEVIAKAIDKKGVKIEFGTVVKKIRDKYNRTSVFYEKDGVEKKIDCDIILVATGRVPNTGELNLPAAGVETNEKGAVKTDSRLRTSVPGIWAIGDVVGGPHFTYISKDDAKIVLSDIKGGSRTTDRLVPSSVFLSPSFSRVGLTEKAAVAQGHRVKTALFFPGGISRCHALGHYTGILKAVVDADTDMILGVSLFCDESHEMINIVKLAMDLKQPYTVIRDQIFTHPIMSEALSDLFAKIK